jgi:hypothetical protein
MRLRPGRCAIARTPISARADSQERLARASAITRYLGATSLQNARAQWKGSTLPPRNGGGLWCRAAQRCAAPGRLPSAAAPAAGLAAETLGQWPLRLPFASWTERMRTPAATAVQIQALFAGAHDSVRAVLALEPDGTFTCPVALLRAHHQE